MTADVDYNMNDILVNMKLQLSGTVASSGTFALDSQANREAVFGTDGDTNAENDGAHLIDTSNGAYTITVFLSLKNDTRL